MIALALQAAVAFNLICTGTHVTATLADEPPRLRERTETQVTWTYRVDLDARRWCRDECQTTKEIRALTDTMIYFDRWVEQRGGIDAIAHVSRETGNVLDGQTAGNQVSVWQGRCERAPFTGFPARRF